ncbi:MAG: hypothetical protein ACYCW6_10785 [Candidatus Xenobia bacterium]
MSLGGGAIRTPIRFGSTVQGYVDRLLPGRTLIVDETGERFIVLAWHRELEDGWHSFLMVQGARQAGRFTIETGLSRRPSYPYYEGHLRPFMAVDSIRLRMDEDRWWTYKSQAELEVHLNKVLRQEHDLALMQHWRPSLEDELGRSMDGWLGWKDAEASSHELPLGQRFAECVREREALDYIQTALASGRYNRVLGPLVRHYLEDERWLSCHTYQMAMLLENVSPETISQYDGSWTGFSEDQSMWLTGRVSLCDWVEVPPDYEARAAQYCFLKALAVCEAWLGA